MVGSIVGITAIGAVVTLFGLGRLGVAVTIADLMLAAVAVVGILASKRAMPPA